MQSTKRPPVVQSAVFAHSPVRFSLLAPHSSLITGVTLLPRSLLWRTVLLIALLLVAGNVAWLQIFRVSEREPRAAQAAQQIASVVNLTRSALITANPEKRLDLLRDLSQQEGIELYAGEPNEAVMSLPDSPFAQLITENLRQRLGADTELQIARDGTPNVWISFKIEDEQYWVNLPRERLEGDGQLRWIGWGALVLLLSVIGAILIVSRINRPLRELTRSATEIGHGLTPPPVTESGPSEIRTLSRAFNQMMRDLHRIDADRALLLAGVSHDLRTPLSRLRLGIEMLDAHVDAALREGMVQDIADLDAVINQFLDFARVAEEQNVTSEVSLNELVASTVERYQRLNNRICVRLDNALPLLRLNAPGAQRLLTNLVDNALRHGSPDVEIETAYDLDRVTLSVLDRGPGIPETETERMLQPFTRLNQARSTSGSGLGLAIVDRIARLNGGKIELLPRAGGGLEARASFPVVPENR